MFSSLFAKPVECFAYENGKLYLQSKKPLNLGQSITVKGPVAGNPDFRIQGKVRLLECHAPQPNWTEQLEANFGQVQPYLYSALPEMPSPLLQKLESHFADARRHPRVQLRDLKALSGDFPGLKATVVDLSLGGVGLLLEGPLAEGRELTFQVSGLELRGLVRWCRCDPGKGFRAGLEFLELNHQQRQKLREWMGA